MNKDQSVVHVRDSSSNVDTENLSLQSTFQEQPGRGMVVVFLLPEPTHNITAAR
jgi:hypothetical protein